MNLYGYGAGDPINNSDPFGLCPQKETGKPCTLSDIFTLNVSFGAQLGAHYNAGVSEGGIQFQAWRVGTVSMTLKAAELTMSDAELSGEAYFTVLGQGGGGKIDLLADGPIVTSRSQVVSGAVGHETTQNHRGSGKSSFGVSAAFGISLDIDWKAAREAGQRMLDEARKRLAKEQP